MILFVVFLGVDSSGQSFDYQANTNVRASYNSAIIYPGFKLGLERPYSVTKFERYKRNKVKTHFMEKNLIFSLGMYHHTEFHTHYYLQGEWVRRKQRKSGFYRENTYGLGLSRAFLDGPTFSVNNLGEVKKIPLAGVNYALFSIGGSLGYNFDMKFDKPFAIFLKTTGIFYFPHSKFVNFRPTIELGGQYQIKGFWEANPTYKTKIKGRKKYRPQN